MLTFHLNDRTVTYGGKRSKRLIDVLRDDFGLTGAKLGCGIGRCGACMVLVDGKPTLSCRTPVSAVEGRAVATAEGLAAEGLNAVQEALLEAGAVQCGYCTPGVAVLLTSVLEQNPEADRRTITKALEPHLCRCTGYAQMIEAAENVARGEAGRPEGGELGSSPLRHQGDLMAAGRLRYTADLKAPDMLFGAIRWADHPHALVRDIDTSAAEQIPGVVAVLTHRDVPGDNHYGKAVKDQPVLCGDRVRFVGDKIALVAAQTEEAARQAADRIRVEYEVLPLVGDPEAALADGSPRLFDGGNLAAERWIRRGDVDRAFAEAAFIHEATFRTPFVEHAPLEPEAALATFDEEGRLTVIAPSQNVFFDRHEISRILGLDKHRVRVIQAPTGGAFGKREDMVVQPLAALAAWKLQRPVKIVLTREESFRSTTKRHPMVIRRRLAADASGRLTALDVDLLADTGAYTSWAPNILRKACVHATGPYFISHVRLHGRSVYTNNAFSGAFRGFGATQVLFAAERHMDMAARAWGFDPVELRHWNLLQDGGRTATQELPAGLKVTVGECLDRALEAVGAAEAAGKNGVRGGSMVRRGTGCAAIFYGIGYGGGIPDISGARISLTPAGRFLLQVGAVDYGQGSSTIFRQIAAHALGTEFELVDIHTADSETTPDSGSTVASRQTTVTGRAVQEAAERLRQKLDQAAWDLGLRYDPQDPESLKLLHARLAGEGRPVEAFARHNLATDKLDQGTGQGVAYATYAWGAQAAEVEVNLRTGKVRVLRLAAVHDVGRVLHRQALRGQVFGAVAQGLGMALMEEYRVEGGQPKTLNFDTYRLPRVSDMPEMTIEFLESAEPLGPYGARGIGEPALVGTAPAIVNAVCDALGFELTDLPVKIHRKDAKNAKEINRDYVHALRHHRQFGRRVGRR
ncbi:MAG: aldehyde oxidase [Candidatus Zixiibacteriota bacterium]|nr:MAG: aldehyde oxidase [candidate division Zixibacteria bacterium]